MSPFQIRIVDAGPVHRGFVKSLSATVFARFGDYETLLPAMFDLPWVHTSIATIAGKPVGFTMVSTEDLASGVIDLVAIAVAPERQSCGVGRLLLTHVESEARRLIGGQPAIVKLTVAEDNPRALDLFRRSGYVRYRQEPGTYPRGQESVEMRKTVNVPSQKR